MTGWRTRLHEIHGVGRARFHRVALGALAAHVDKFLTTGRFDDNLKRGSSEDAPGKVEYGRME